MWPGMPSPLELAGKPCCLSEWTELNFKFSSSKSVSLFRLIQFVTKRHLLEHDFGIFRWSRKRRTSMSDNSDTRGDTMDDCMAALVLMRLSCSPKSIRLLESDSGVFSIYFLPPLLPRCAEPCMKRHVTAQRRRQRQLPLPLPAHADGAGSRLRNRNLMRKFPRLF